MERKFQCSRRSCQMAYPGNRHGLEKLKTQQVILLKVFQGRLISFLSLPVLPGRRGGSMEMRLWYPRRCLDTARDGPAEKMRPSGLRVF